MRLRDWGWSISIFQPFCDLFVERFPAFGVFVEVRKRIFEFLLGKAIFLNDCPGGIEGNGIEVRMFLFELLEFDIHF